MAYSALITGATGLLGREIFNSFKKAGWLTVGQGFSRAKLPTIIKANLEEPDEIIRLLDEAKPQVIVHSAANRSPDACEKNPEQAKRLNVDATRTLAEAASKRGILLIYISTDYVFPGVEGEAPYEADAPTRPTNRYGELKRDGEVAVLEATRETGLGLVLRVPLLYGPAESNSESAVNVLLDQIAKARDPAAPPISMDDWAQRYPTNTQDVARVCNDVAVRYIQERSKGGDLKRLPKILQFSAEERMTKYEMCQVLARILGVEIPAMVPNRKGNDPGAAVQRPFNTKLSTKVLADLGINLHAQKFEQWWREALKGRSV